MEQAGRDCVYAIGSKRWIGFTDRLSTREIVSGEGRSSVDYYTYIPAPLRLFA